MKNSLQKSHLLSLFLSPSVPVGCSDITLPLDSQLLCTAKQPWGACVRRGRHGHPLNRHPRLGQTRKLAHTPFPCETNQKPLLQG